VADPVAPDTDAPADAEPAAPVVELEHGVPVSRSRGQKVLHPTREQLHDVVRALRDDGYDQLLDVTAVDFLAAEQPRPLPPGIEPERFELVVGLISHAKRERVRLRVQVPADDLRVPSLFDLHPGSEYLERETFDMFGIVFEDHPDLSRILMPEDWIGHPLRKDYAVGQIPVQFKGAPSSR
jgi:NADH-quinone oxidoreductase subunit C